MGKDRRVKAGVSVQQEIIQCACGCGTWIERYYVHRGYWHERSYVHSHHALGKPISEEHKKKLRLATLTEEWRQAYDEGMRERRHNENWRKSVSREATLARWDRRGRKPTIYIARGYPPEFNERLRRSIRERDAYRCRRCGCYSLSLSVHHIDMNKMNNSPQNLVSLCSSCHTKVHNEIRRTKTLYLFPET